MVGLAKRLEDLDTHTHDNTKTYERRHGSNAVTYSGVPSEKLLKSQVAKYKLKDAELILCVYYTNS